MIENDLTRIAVALEGILAHLNTRPVMPEMKRVSASTEEPKPAENNQALAVEEPPKKKRGRPSKADLAARADTAMDAVQAEVREDEEAHVAAAALPVENQPAAPVNPNAETEKAIEKAREPVLTIEKVREAAIALTQRCEKAKAGTGRDALVAVLAKFSAKSISELPEAKWAEFVAQMKAA